MRTQLRQVWNALPDPLRRPIRQAVRRPNHLDPIPRRVTSAQKAAGFVTLSGGTPRAIYDALRLLRNTGPLGDYYEFGLYRGYTFWYAQFIARRLDFSTMQFEGFDSFAGLPDVRGCDAETGEFRTGDYAVPLEAVRRSLTTWGVDWHRTGLHEGFFDRLSPDAEPARPAALILVDCDLYDSTIPVLRFLYPRLQHGSVLIFDDWNCFGGSENHGERRALAEFLNEHRELSMEPLFPIPPVGQAFTVRIKTLP